MSDLYECVLAVDLRADLSEDALAELRWHLGTGPLPARFPTGTDSYLETYPSDDPAHPECRWHTPPPQPLFAATGPAYSAGGALAGVLVLRERPSSWALTVRQELHPDSFYQLRSLLEWLGGQLVEAGPPVRYLGLLRSVEELAVVPLLWQEGVVQPPEVLIDHTPLWR